MHSNDSVRHDKHLLRRKVQEACAAINPESKLHLEDLLKSSLDQWLKAIHAAAPMTILAFWPSLPEEPGFIPWLKSLNSLGLHLGLPRMNWQDRSLRFFHISNSDHDLEVTRSGVVQPRANQRPVDLSDRCAMIVPGLAFDRSGNRLGRGAGFYDRTIAQLPPEIPRWALAFEEQLVEQVPVDSWDKPVHGLILPSGLFPIHSDS